MKKILLAASCLVVMSACNNISGILTVNSGQTLQLKDKSGRLVTFESGNANVDMSKGKIVITGITDSGKNDKVELDGTNLPGYDEKGEHNWVASSNAQPVNIDELNQDTGSTSGEYNGWESCSFSEDVPVPCPPPAPPAPPAGHPPGGPDKPAPVGPTGPFHPKPGTPPPSQHASVNFKKGRHVADEGCYATRIFRGHQAISFHFGSNSFEVQLIFTDPKTGTQLATFQGFSDTSGRVIDTVSPCFR